MAVTAAACVLFLWLFPAAMVWVDSSFLGDPADAEELEVPDFAEKAPAVGGLAPDFVLTDVDGEPFRLSDHVGKVPVVIEFGSFT